MRNLAAILPYIALSITSAFGQDCGKEEKQIDINECYSKQLRHSEQNLSDLISTVRSRLQGQLPDAVPALELAQESWVVYRDAECLFALSGSAGASIYPTNLLICKDNFTRERARRLSSYLTCREAAAECPVPNR